MKSLIECLKSRSIILLFGLVACVPAFSQVTSFKLSDFKYRTPLYRSLQLDLFVHEAATNRNDKTGSGDQKSFAYNFDGSIQQNQTIATDERLHRSMWYAYLQSTGTWNNAAGAKTRQSLLAPDIYYDFQERKYKREYFIEYGASIGGNLLMKKDKAQGPVNAHRETNATLAPFLSIGKGRLEYVQDAQTALYILNDLYNEGIITSPVSAELANKFAQQITLMKRTRKIDQRRRAIYQLTTIDSFLTSNKIIKQCDSKTAAIINDNLFYGFTNDLSGRDYTYTPYIAHPMDFTRGLVDEGEQDDYGWMPFLEPVSDQMFRKHGTIMIARVNPVVRYADYQDKLGDSVITNSTIAGNVYMVPAVELIFEKHNAIDLKWQKNVVASVRAQRSVGDKIIKSTNISVGGNYVLGYYPNNRTVVEADAGIRFLFLRTNDDKSHFIEPTIGLKSGYFLNYNTVLRGSFTLRYNRFTGSSKSGEVQQFLSLSVRHYFY